MEMNEVLIKYREFLENVEIPMENFYITEVDWRIKEIDKLIAKYKKGKEFKLNEIENALISESLLPHNDFNDLFAILN